MSSLDGKLVADSVDALLSGEAVYSSSKDGKFTFLDGAGDPATLVDFASQGFRSEANSLISPLKEYVGGSVRFSSLSRMANDEVSAS